MASGVNVVASGVKPQWPKIAIGSSITEIPRYKLHMEVSNPWGYT